MVDQRRPERFRVSGEDEDGDIHAFESDSRGRANAMKLVFEEGLTDVIFDKRKL